MTQLNCKEALPMNGQKKGAARSQQAAPVSKSSPKPNDTDVYCPSCGETLSGGWPLSDADDLRKLCQCPNCGQSIDDTRCEAAEAALDAMGGENNA